MTFFDAIDDIVNDFFNFERKVSKPQKSTKPSTSDSGIDVKISSLINRIIMQDSATVIFWKNGDKTSVKCSDLETFDPEKGIAMAVLKYLFKDYYNDIQELIAKYPYTSTTPAVTTPEVVVEKTTTKKSTAKKSTSKKTTTKKSTSTKKSATKKSTTSKKSTSTTKKTTAKKSTSTAKKSTSSKKSTKSTSKKSK